MVVCRATLLWQTGILGYPYLQLDEEPVARENPSKLGITVVPHGDFLTYSINQINAVFLVFHGYFDCAFPDDNHSDH